MTFFFFLIFNKSGIKQIYLSANGGRQTEFLTIHKLARIPSNLGSRLGTIFSNENMTRILIDQSTFLPFPCGGTNSIVGFVFIVGPTL